MSEKLYCKFCRKKKDPSEFSKDSRSKTGHKSKCRVCHNTYVREVWYTRNRERQQQSSKRWREQNGDRIEEVRLQRLVESAPYLDSVEQAKALYARKVCEVCGREPRKKANDRLVIDHCHETNKVRGVLCSNCNYGIGYLGDKSDRLLKAYLYLSRFESRVILSTSDIPQ